MSWRARVEVSACVHSNGSEDSRAMHCASAGLGTLTGQPQFRAGAGQIPVEAGGRGAAPVKDLGSRGFGHHGVAPALPSATKASSSL
jgi:hypothetical protein